MSKKPKEKEWFEITFNEPDNKEKVYYGIYAYSKEEAIEQVKKSQPQGFNFK